MHLHILCPMQRRAGLGAVFVQQPARVYFQVLQLQLLFSEPNAFNVAPNRTLQRAGFRYLFTHETTPGPINFPQAATRWVLDQDGLAMGRERGSPWLGRAMLTGPAVVAREGQLRVAGEHRKSRLVAALVEGPDVATNQHPDRSFVHHGPPSSATTR